MAPEEQSAVRVIRPNRLTGWSAVVLTVVLVWLAASYVPLPWAGAAEPVVWVALLAAFLEALWRFDFRPQLRWNRGGLVVVDGSRVRRLAWHEVSSVEVRANTILVRATGEVFQARYDRPYWLPLLAKRYRDLPSTIEEDLNSVRVGALHDSTVPPPETGDVGRPAFLYVAFAAGVVGVLAHHL
ncbi:hypothetical protein ACQPZX_15325 [Actinoplanes sp. CA-142083]|uniref:hypothetical protein n=1 Tax=Actinoplanes sp. CA-142083 TaxID=3239903 RepID=UPI003D8E4973